MNQYLVLADEVRMALESRQPVVLLESTLFAHGLPYPENLQLYQELEEMALSQGVVPAVVVILQGQIHVGFDRIALPYWEAFPKAGLQDLPVLLSQGLCGATTVATTMQVAAKIGVKTFVTGGIGGVHPDGNNSFDISGDLMALTRFPVVVICSGAKSILDLSKTRELLETLGITVLGYRSSSFPAFFLRESGLLVDHQVETVEEVAKLLAVKEELDLPGGVLFTNPIPPESQVDPVLFERALMVIQSQLQEEGVTGKDITPFLLAGLQEETQGATLKANLALVKSNMELGIELAQTLRRF